MSRFIVLAASVVLLACAGSPGAANAGAKRVALVIGNSAYRSATELSNPRRDAADLAAVLSRLDFQVITGFDLDRASMLKTIRKFADSLVGANVGVLYYAGHGLQVNGRNYLVPVDAQLTDVSGLDFELVPLELIQRTMEYEAPSNVIFLDACRDNPLARNLARSMGTRSGSVGRGLAPVESGVGTLISFSTQPGNVALDGSGRNSPFAGALVEELGRKPQDISSVLINVRRRVMRETDNKQVPWEHSALTDRFYFAQPDMATTGTNDAGRDTQDNLDNAEMRRMLEEMRQAREALNAARREREAEAAAESAAQASANDDKRGEQRASLAAPTGEQSAADASELVRGLQRQLKRVGCDPGDIDGDWGPKAQSALERFARHAGLALHTDAPTQAALDAVSARTTLICPRECPGSEVFDALGNCVAGKPAPVHRSHGTSRARGQSGSPGGGGGFGGGRRFGGGGCRGGNMAHCRLRCSQGVQRACRRLQRGY